MNYVGMRKCFYIDVLMIIIANNNNLDDLNKSYEKTMRKVKTSFLLN